MRKKASTTYGISVIGNLNVDLLIRGVDTLPMWGQEIVGSDHASFVAGQAGYLALGIAAWGTPVAATGVVGDDGAGSDIIRELQASGVDTSGVQRLPGEQTGLTIALVRPDGERAFASNIGCSGMLTAEKVKQATSSPRPASYVALVGLFMTPNFTPTDAKSFLKQCKLDGSTTVLDTGWDPDNWQPETLAQIRELLSVVDLFLPNLDEARAITGQAMPEHALSALSDLCPGTIVIKCGGNGSLSWHQGKALRHEAHSVPVVDTVGAGDVFNAGLLAALSDNLTIDQAVERAHVAASLYVSRTSDRYPSRSDVEIAIASNTN